MERLHTLIQLAEEGSLIRAAKGDAGLQSRFSHQLKDLSTFFGVALTDRVGKTIRLTEPGERLVKLVREHFQSLTQFMNDAKGHALSFRLGSADSLQQWLVVPSVARLRRPGVSVRFALESLRPEEIVARLQDQRLEFGLVPSSVELRGLKTRVICRVSHIIVVPYRISNRRGILSLRQALLECPHASTTAMSPVRRSIDQIAEKLGQRYLPQLECASEGQVAAAVRTGLFAAVLPQWAWESHTPLEHFIYDGAELEQLNQKLVLTWHPRFLETRGHAGEEVRDSLCSTLEELATTSSGFDKN